VSRRERWAVAGVVGAERTMKWTVLVGSAAVYFLLLVVLSARQINSGVERFSKVNFSQQRPGLNLILRQTEP
jgi:hypothetical protein